VINLNFDDARRYLRAGESISDDYLRDVAQELEELASVKKACLVSPAHREDGFYVVDELDLVLPSNDINALFDQVDSIAVFVVTLGIGVDKKIAFYSHTDMVRSMVLDSLASVYVESVLDELHSECDQKQIGKYPTMRFSPGYGDCPLEIQRQIGDNMDIYRRLGITLSSSNLMIPQKSITAFVGYSDKKQVFSNVCLTCPRQGKCTTKCNKAR